VPIWASILAPIVLGMIFSFWGVLLAAPLLAVVYAYRARVQQQDRQVTPRIGPPGPPG
jgi:predicted PurR-regulated permease PerM